LRVKSVDRLTDDSLAVTFDVPEELREDFRFSPGQHVSLRVPQAGDEVRRSYSICTPASSGVLRIGVKCLPDGVFSTFAAQRLRPGDTIEVMTPAGRFTAELDPANAKHYCAIAAGSGITPVLSIVASALEIEQRSRCTVLYGNRTTAAVMFLEELADLKDRYPDRLQVVHVLSRERQEAEVVNGRLDGTTLPALLDAFVPVDTVDEWFLCGPAEMIEASRSVLAERGVESAHVHRELFHTGPAAPVRRPDAAQPPGQSEVTVKLDGRSSTFTLSPYDEPILDATLKVRADAPYACKNGMCGTCRAMLVEGTVEMDHNYALEESELTAGFVLACQSHPTSAAVMLDFDA
jgi:ring-1,2-phenylacetyl-CoA epoxidase subunit PaaE